MYQQTLNILIIFAEVSILVLSFSVLSWLVSKTFKQLSKISWLKQWEQNLKKLRRNIQVFLILSCLLLCVIVVGINGWQIYQGKNLNEYTLTLIRTIPQEVWGQLAIATVKSILLLTFAIVAQKSIRLWLNKAADRAKQFGEITANHQTIDAFFRFLSNTITWSLWVLSLSWCGKFFGLPEVALKYIYIALRIYLIIAFGLLCIKATVVIINSFDGLSAKYSQSRQLTAVLRSLQTPGFIIQALSGIRNLCSHSNPRTPTSGVVC